MQARFTYSSPSPSALGPGAAPSSGTLPTSVEFQAVEAAGFESILLPAGPDDLGAFRQASAALDATERLGVILSCRPSRGSPTASVRRVAALAGRAEGRLALFAEPEHPQSGHATHQVLLRRLDEYLRLFGQLWLNERPIDHEGEHYRLRRAHIGARPGGAGPRVHMGGVSGTALQVAGRHADVFHLPPGRLEETAALIGRVREAAAMRGRSRKLLFAVAVDASGLVSARRAGVRSRGLSHASETQRLAGIVACCRDLGVGEFVVTGLEDHRATEAFGQHVLPALRSATRAQTWLPEPPLAGIGTLLS